MKEVAKEHKPAAAFELVDTEMGGMMAGSAGKLPRSKAQLSDVRKRLFGAERGDDLAIMMERCKCLKEGEMPFVRSVQAAPQPLCVLATDTQLKQLQLCCTDPSNFSVLSIDPTFNLGSFFVTPMVFLHKVVMSKRTQKHPIFLGPMLIHQRMNLEAYSYFAHQIQILLPSLRNIKALGTDGELALMGAFQDAFQNAIPLRCFKHFQDNCESKLRSLNLDDTAHQEILADIVGVEQPECRQLGLVDAVDLSDFDAKLAALEERWNKLEKEGRRVVPGETFEPEFYSWFVREKRDVVRSSMIQSVRKAAQLGDPPEKFYTNASESTNNILKLKVDRKPQSLPAFVDHVQELASAYEKNIERAFFRRGDWRLANSLSALEDASESLPQKKQKSLVKKVLEASCSLSALVTEAALRGGDTQGAPTSRTQSTSMGASRTQSTSMGASRTQSTTMSGTTKGGGFTDCSSSSYAGKGKELSVSYHALIESGSNIHKDTLEGIWTKSESLVNDTTLIVPVPGSSSSYHRMVASSTGECPHLVTTPAKFTGQFKCDAKCPMYATYKICSHTVAAAEVNGKLAQFVQWLIKQKCSPNLTNLSMVGIPKGAGQKGGVPKNTRKRKRTVTLPAQGKPVVDRLTSGTPSSTVSDSQVSSGASSHTTGMQQSSSTAVHGQQINVQGPGASVWSPNFPPPLPIHWNTWLLPPVDHSTMAPPFPAMPDYSSLPTHSAIQPFSSASSSNLVVSPYPFTLKILTQQIRICQGCRIPFHSGNDQPPYNLVVCRKECRPYKAPDGQIKTPSTPSNSHYHVNLHCIRAAEPTFMPGGLVVPDEVRSCLSDSHRHFIYSMLGIYI